jgi:hypothetical protein
MLTCVYVTVCGGDDDNDDGCVCLNVMYMRAHACFVCVCVLAWATPACMFVYVCVRMSLCVHTYIHTDTYIHVCS